LTVLAFLAGFILLSKDSLSAGPFAHDEPDYMYAASLGLVANYTDTPSMPFPQYIRMGMTQGRDPGNRLGLSASIRSSGDVTFYRHWHGPLYYYWLIGTSRLTTDEQLTRASGRVFAVLAFLLIYFGCVWILPGERGWIAAVIASALYLWSYVTVRATELAPHSLFVTCYIAALILSAKLLQTGRRAYWYAALAATALAFCTLEVAFVLLATVVICGCLARRQLRPDWKFVLISAALFLGTVLLVWPGALLKLSFLKAYLFMAYLAIARKSPWGQATFLETWWLRFVHSPLEWLVLAGAVVLYLWPRSIPEKRPVLPFLVFAAVMLAALLRVITDTPRYMLPFLPAFQLFAGIVWSGPLARLRALPRYALTAVTCVLLLASTYWQLPPRPPDAPSRNATLVADINGRGLTDQKLLVPQDDVPMLHYYFPRAQLRAYLDEGNITEELSQDDFRAVVYPGYPLCYQPRVRP
jgi:4-amino-4-deoxy-L-arabinose transferase-like glycosyltransferase